MADPFFPERGFDAEESGPLTSHLIEPAVTPWAAGAAAFQSTPNITSWVGQKISEFSVGEDDLSVDEISKQYEIDVDEPMTPTAAASVKAERRRVDDLRFWMGQADQARFGSTLFPVIGGLAKGFLDPVALVGAWGLQGLAGAVGVMSMAQKTAGGLRSFNSGMLNTIKLGFANQTWKTVGASALLEGAAYDGIVMRDYYENTLGEEYSMGDIAIGLMGNMIGNFAMFQLGRSTHVMNAKQVQKEVWNIVSQGEYGKHINPNFVRDEYLRNIWTKRTPEELPIAKRSTNAIMKEGKVYGSMKGGTAAVHRKNYHQLGPAYGEGVVFSADPDIARNASYNDLNPSDGTTVELRLNSSTKLMDIDVPITDIDGVKASLKDMFTYLSSEEKAAINSVFKNNGTMKELLDVIEETSRARGIDFTTDFTRYFSDRGYSGIKYNTGDTVGRGTSTDLIQVFGDEGIKDIGVTEDWANSYPRAPQENLTNTGEYANHIKNPETDVNTTKSHYDDAMDEVMVRKTEEATKVKDSASSEAELATVRKEVEDELRAMGEDPEAMKVLLDDIAVEARSIAEFEKLGKCLLGL